MASKFKWILIGSISLAFTLLLYPTIYYYSAIFLTTYVIYYLIIHKKNLNYFFGKIVPIIVTFFISLGLGAIQLIPQLEFGQLSTRSQLKLEEVALPLWSLKRFVTSLTFPYIDFQNFNHEAFLYLGAVPSILAILGFSKLPLIKKMILGFFGIFTLMFVAGLSTPIFAIAFDLFPYLKYSRITTRLWFIVALIVSLLAAYSLQSVKRKVLVYFLISIFLVESFYIGYQKIFSIPNLSFENQQIYKYLAQDKDLFRIYCATYCFNPQLISMYNLQTLHGETPIQSANFVNFLQSAGGYQYKDFAIIFPPYQVWQTTNPPIPNASFLAKANVKYLASTYELKRPEFQFIKNFDNILLYENNLYKQRIYFQNTNDTVQIEKYTPNRVIINFNKSTSPRKIIFSEQYYPGWEISINNQKFPAEKQNSIFRKITVPPNTGKLEMIYNPDSFKLGRLLTLSTILFLILYSLHIRKKKQK